MRISVSMCTFNGSRFIREQLDSISAQARLPDELVVCDDRSTDGTADAVRAYARRAPFPVRLSVNGANVGPTRNFERAIGLCRGDVIALCDQDDVWRPDKLERLEGAFFDRPRLGAAFSDAEVVDERCRPLGYTLWGSIRFNGKEQCLVNGGRALDVLLRYNVVAGATMALNAVYRDRILPIPAGWVHDAWIAIACAACGGLAAIDAPLVEYRTHGEQQIGVRGDGHLGHHVLEEARKALADPAGYLGRCREDNLKEIERSLGQYQGACGILPAAAVGDKLAHLRARAAMACLGRAGRLPLLARELVSLRYRRYSNGIAYVAKDLLL